VTQFDIATEVCLIILKHYIVDIIKISIHDGFPSRKETIYSSIVHKPATSQWSKFHLSIPLFLHKGASYKKGKGKEMLSLKWDKAGKTTDFSTFRKPVIEFQTLVLVHSL